MKTISSILNNEAWRSVILVVIGFFLAQLKDFFAQRRERKEAVSVLLADLLEVRYQFVVMELLVAEIANIGSLPEQSKSQLRVALDSFLPKWQELHDRYDKSVTALARIDPLLSFQLRSKDSIRPILLNVHSIMSQDSQAATMMAPAIKNNLVNKGETALNESILKLAKRQSLRCWYRTRRKLRHSNEIPDNVRDAFDPIRAIIQAQIRASSGATVTPNPESQKQATS